MSGPIALLGRRGANRPRVVSSFFHSGSDSNLRRAISAADGFPSIGTQGVTSSRLRVQPPPGVL